MIMLTHLPGPVLPVRLEDVPVKVVFVELLFNEREPDGIFCPLTQSPILSSKSTFKTITAILTYLDTMARPEQSHSHQYYQLCPLSRQSLPLLLGHDGKAGAERGESSPITSCEGVVPIGAHVVTLEDGAGDIIDYKC